MIANPILRGTLKSNVSSAIPTSNLLAQWESDSIVGLNNGDPVSSWPDLSSFGRTATQSNSSKQPIFTTGVFGTKPGLLFNSAVSTDMNYSKGSPNDYTGNLTVFAVAEPQTDASSYSLGIISWFVSAPNGNGFALNADGGGAVGAKIPHLTTFNSSTTETNNKKIGTSWTSGTKHLITWTFDGSTVVGRSDGVNQTLTTSDGGYGSDSLIGKSFTWMKGYIGAIIIYNTVLSGTDISTIENYLNTKYTIF